MPRLVAQRRAHRPAPAYHLIFADFQNCGLGCWGDQSQISRAVSQSPTGPFKKVEVIAGAEHTNPTLNKVPGGPYVIVSAGNGSSSFAQGTREAAVGRSNVTIGASDPPEAGLITMLYSDKITGPWKPRPGPQLILPPGPPDTWDAFVTNPSIYFYPNGSALMAYRGGPCLNDPAHNGTCGKPGVPNSPHVAFATAPRWDAEFTRLGSQPAWMERTEDPGGLCGSSFDGAASCFGVHLLFLVAIIA